MNLTDLIRSQARNYKCSACGESMADCGIKVISRQENRAAVRVTCAACLDEKVMQVVFHDPEALAAALPPEPPAWAAGHPEIAAPITADDLVDLWRLLDRHTGDLRSLLQPAAA